MDEGHEVLLKSLVGGSSTATNASIQLNRQVLHQWISAKLDYEFEAVGYRVRNRIAARVCWYPSRVGPRRRVLGLGRPMEPSSY
jgi:hypothetical protein